MNVCMTLRGCEVEITLDVLSPPEPDVGIMGYQFEIVRIVDEATREELDWELTDYENAVLGEIVHDKAMAEE